jgi:hypothetical protein
MLTLTPHTTDSCPVNHTALVAYRLEGDTETYTDRARSVCWALRGEPGRVAAYAVIEFAD